MYQVLRLVGLMLLTPRYLVVSYPAFHNFFKDSVAINTLPATQSTTCNGVQSDYVNLDLCLALTLPNRDPKPTISQDVSTLSANEKTTFLPEYVSHQIFQPNEPSFNFPKSSIFIHLTKKRTLRYSKQPGSVQSTNNLNLRRIETSVKGHNSAERNQDLYVNSKRTRKRKSKDSIGGVQPPKQPRTHVSLLSHPVRVS
ncbi:hypothetical protein O181_047253 [Austropuccinia psidii MF-1]|uniref:Uncharacterized protein n=1 Tax=Austropuccinia psidii MF-1 TaxID=1389203 RepID=A0A9Q3DVN3_9BASI|nr:hypothetical protein [Austropuccinia psidii MF-1]